MKTDLTTAIITAIVGVLAAYFLVNTVIMKDPAPVIVKGLEEPASTTLAEPDPSVFNYRALNPTVETYVDCANYDASGSCINEEQ